MRRATGTLLALLLLAARPASAQVVRSIEFPGLDETDPDYLAVFLTCREGEALDSLAFEGDLQALRNLQLFRTVEGEVRHADGGVDLVITVDEKTTLLPILGYQTIEDNYKLTVGAVDRNFLGRGAELGGYYQYYQRHSFELFSRVPYLQGSRFGMSARVRRMSTLEPAYFEGGTASYDVDRNSLLVGLDYDLSRAPGRGNRYVLSTGVELLRERYTKNVEASGPDSPGPPGGTFDKYLFRSAFFFQNVDYFWHHLDGIRTRTSLEVVADEGEGMGFVKAANEAAGYLRATGTLDLAVRLVVGVSTNKNTPFVPFVIDSYENVRGSGDRVARGTAQLVLNVELRQTVFRNDWLAVQLDGFFDFGSLRPAGGSLRDLFADRSAFTSFGPGARIHLFPFYGSILRADWAVGPGDADGLVVGVGQYF